MITICKACGKELHLADLPPGELNDIISRKVLPQVVHNHCFDEWKDRIKRIDEARAMAARNAQWETLCPPLYQGTDIGRLPNQKASQEALKWVYSPTGMIFYGASGKGKTRTMWLVLRQAFAEGRFVAATTHTDFAANATLANQIGNASILKWVKMLQTADVLFIDDLGKSRFKTMDGSSRAAEEILFSILEKRWTNQLPVMLTTNGTQAQFEAQMSKDMATPFLRRLREYQEAIHF